MIPENNVAAEMPDWLDARLIVLERHRDWCDSNRFDADIAGWEQAAEDWADERDELAAAIMAVEAEWRNW